MFSLPLRGSIQFNSIQLVNVLHHKDVGVYCPCVKCNLPGVYSKAQGRVWYANRNHDAADLKDWTIEEVLQVIRQHEQIVAGLKAAGTCPDEIKKVIAFCMKFCCASCCSSEQPLKKTLKTNIKKLFQIGDIGF